MTTPTPHLPEPPDRDPPVCPTCGGDGLVGCDTGDGDWRCDACDGTGTIGDAAYPADEHECDCECATCNPPPSLYAVTVYLTDRAYGGPEEGGWYYDCGQPIDFIPEGIEPADLVRIFPGTRDGKLDALAWRAALQVKLDSGINVGRREISSVLSEGMYTAEISSGLPKPYPATIPHYE